MIKLIKDWKDYQKDQLHDFGCVRNKWLVEQGYAVWIKVQDVKFKVK